MKKIMMFVIIIGFSIALLGQVGSVFSNPSFINSDLSFSSIFNPNTFSINHSASFSSGINSSRNAFYQSIYTTHMNFKFHPKFTMGMDLNFINLGTANVDSKFKVNSNHDNSTIVMPELNLTYQPKENMYIRFEFRHASFVDNNLNQNSQYWRW
jgi:hypothetical protein